MASSAIDSVQPSKNTSRDRLSGEAGLSAKVPLQNATTFALARADPHYTTPECDGHRIQKEIGMTDPNQAQGSPSPQGEPTNGSTLTTGSPPVAGSSPSLASSSLDSRAEEALARFQADITRLQALLAATEADRATLQDRLNQSAALLANIETQQADSSATATFAAAAKAQIADAQGVIATKSAHIQDAQTHADKIRGDLDRTLTAAQAQLTDIEGNKDRAKTTADTVAAQQAAIAASKTAGEADALLAKNAAAAATADALTTKSLADKAAAVESRVAGYESRLADFEQRAAKQLQDILDLLPGATSAGLAHAFDKRRNTFLEPSKRWQWIFVGSIIALALLAVTGLFQVYNNGSLTYGELFRHWLSRAPIAASLVWLALHASRESGLAKRLEEDYGYKSAIASSFQGFQQQMREIGATAAPNSPLGKLCDDTLLTLATPPGRIYEKHALNVTPSTELAALAKVAVEAVLAKKSE
jgi:hypothetical protein